MIWACDEKRGALRRKDGEEIESTREKKEKKTNEKMVERSEG